MGLRFEVNLKPSGEGLLSVYIRILEARVSGLLDLEWERYRKQIVFRRGEPIFAKSNWPFETFAQFLVRAGHMAQNKIQELLKLKEVDGGSEPFGEFLVRRGIVNGSEMARYLSDHFQERIFNLLALSHGQVVFEEVSESKLENIDAMSLSDPFRQLLWQSTKSQFSEAICRAKLSAFITRRGKLQDEPKLPLLAAELRQWNELKQTYHPVSQLNPLGLQLFAVASEFGQIEWAASDEEKLVAEMRTLLEQIKSQRAHEILGVDIHADGDECKRVYLGFVKRFHPDRLPPQHSPESKQMSEMLFAKINEAYATLTDPDKRREFLAALSLDSDGGEQKIQAHLEAELSIPQAKMALRRRHFRGALDLFRSIADVLKSDGEVLADLTFSEMMSMVEAKEDVKAKLPAIRDRLKKAMEMKQDYAEAYYYRGVAFKLEGLEDKALADFDRALQMNPKLGEAASEARLLRMRKDKKGAGLFGKKS